MRQARDPCSGRWWLQPSEYLQRTFFLISRYRIPNCSLPKCANISTASSGNASGWQQSGFDAHEIDEIRTGITMNVCVARAHAQVIDRLSPSVAYVDACDVNAFRYADMVKGFLDQSCEIVSEHHADQTFRVVSAASIVAKVTRDRAIRTLSKKYGNIGSGYPSDPVTIAFLSEYFDEHKCPPPIARKDWKTVTTMIAQKQQSRLSEFF